MSNLVELNKEIVSDELKPFYILYGEEIGLMNIYINQIKRTVKRETSVQAVWPRLTQKSIISARDVFVIRDDKEFIGNEARWKKLGEVRYGTLILLVTKIDKRSKLLKQYADNVVEFEKLTTAQLENYFKKQYAHLAILVPKVVELCNNDFNRIDNELDKLSRVTLDDIELTDIIYTEEPFEVFDAVDSVIRYEPELALSRVDLMFAKGESPLGFLTLLYNQFVAAAKVFSAKQPKPDTVNVSQFIINKVKHEFNYSLPSAFEGMSILGDVIEGIKQGKYTEHLGTYYALFKIFSLD